MEDECADRAQNGHTIHMVKGAVKPAAQASSTGSSSTGGQPRLPQMGTGLNVAGNPIDSVENVHHVSLELVPRRLMQC